MSMNDSIVSPVRKSFAGRCRMLWGTYVSWNRERTRLSDFTDETNLKRRVSGGVLLLKVIAVAANSLPWEGGDIREEILI